MNVLCNMYLHFFFCESGRIISSPNTIIVINQRIRWAQNISRMAEIKNSFTGLFRKLKGKRIIWKRIS
jgi:hypothetical protein